MGTPRGAARAFLLAAVAHEGSTCLPWPFSTTRDGYGQYLGRHAHTVVLELAGGLAGGHMVAAHAPGICHNRLCVNPAHLRWATRRQNTDDMRIDGTWPAGDQNVKAILTEAQARSVLRDERPLKEIAAELGVSYGCVHAIKRRRSWRHLIETSA